VPEHAELFLLLAMATPLGWLERVPTYKDQIEKLKDRDLSTYGFLGYPLLQAADILIYRATMVPVGEDQVPHIEMTREIARRFNHLFGAEPGFEEKARDAVKKLGAPREALHSSCAPLPGEGRGRRARAGTGADRRGGQPVDGRPRAAVRLREGARRIILVEPEAKLTEALEDAGPRRPEDVEELQQRDRAARGPEVDHEEDPHDADRPGARAPHRQGRARALPGLAAAQGLFRRRDEGVGADGLPQRRHRLPRLQAARDRQRDRELAPMRERAQRYLDDPAAVRNIIADGCDRARELAGETMREVREAMGLARG
jgi:tryptophanyl-tRNA synthetase